MRSPISHVPLDDRTALSAPRTTAASRAAAASSPPLQRAGSAPRILRVHPPASHAAAQQPDH
eukprot:scaffold69713_cov24-Phaeocystis_antarctica.AAC.1